MEILGGILRRRQRRVVFHLLVVHEALIELHWPALPKLSDEGLQIHKLPLRDGLDPARYFLCIRFRQVPRVGARVSATEFSQP